MQPDEQQFSDWLDHPVTEWVLLLMRHEAGAMKDKWASLARESGELEALALCEARTRADCYLAIPDSSFEDWVRIDASRTE